MDDYGSDEYYYSCVADEMNDVDCTTTLADLDPSCTVPAQRYAQLKGLAWPPNKGDFDRYYEMRNGR